MADKHFAFCAKNVFRLFLEYSECSINGSNSAENMNEIDRQFCGENSWQVHSVLQFGSRPNCHHRLIFVAEVNIVFFFFLRRSAPTVRALHVRVHVKIVL